MKVRLKTPAFVQGLRFAAGVQDWPADVPLPTGAVKLADDALPEPEDEPPAEPDTLSALTPKGTKK